MYGDYNSDPPKVGGRAKEIAPKLAKMNEKEFTEFMDNKVKMGRCTVTPEHGVVSPLNAGQSMKSTQTMLKYEYPNGTMVRYKPEGDFKRVGKPTYSIEIKKVATKSDPGGVSAIDAVAFKIDQKARPVPKWPKATDNPYQPGSPEFDVYEDAVMDAGHKILPVK